MLDESAGATKANYEALRRYQRNRLRYYYAVVECDSVDTARILYQECDRQPYEGAGILLDLRYIPSDMNFDEVSMTFIVNHMKREALIIFPLVWSC